MAAGEIALGGATPAAGYAASAIRFPDRLALVDARFGRRLRAFVVVRAGAVVVAEDVRSHVRANLARFRVPRDVVFLDELPRSATGKVLKRELETLSTL